MVRVVRLERTVSWSQTRRDTNFAIPGYSISVIIPRRGRKSKIFLSVVIYVVKATFVPFSAIGGKPAIARTARHSGLLSKQFMDRVYAFPKLALYQAELRPDAQVLYSIFTRIAIKISANFQSARVLVFGVCACSIGLGEIQNLHRCVGKRAERGTMCVGSGLDRSACTLFCLLQTSARC